MGLEQLGKYERKIGFIDGALKMAEALKPRVSGECLAELTVGVKGLECIRKKYLEIYGAVEALQSEILSIGLPRNFPGLLQGVQEHLEDQSERDLRALVAVTLPEFFDVRSLGYENIRACYNKPEFVFAALVRHAELETDAGLGDSGLVGKLGDDCGTGDSGLGNVVKGYDGGIGGTIDKGYEGDDSFQGKRVNGLEDGLELNEGGGS